MKRFRFFVFLSLTFCFSLSAKNNFSGSSVDKELYDFILQILPDGKTMLELGSGWTSGRFAKHYTVHSIEHNPEWLNRYPVHYIFAPIENDWYSLDVLKKELPSDYDLILIDGPPGFIGRMGFFFHLSLFNTNVPLIFDDINRPSELELIQKVSLQLQRPFSKHVGKTKTFGVILPK